MACDDPVLSALTPQDFKDYFFRDFTFVEDFNIATTYSTGDLVFYTTNNKFYKSLGDANVGNLPTDDTKWELQTDISQYISDKDIEKAYEQACINFNSGLFSDDDSKKVAYLYLTAHYLVKDLNENGLSSTGDQLVSSIKVGNVSENYKIPEWMTNDKNLSYFTTTSYGLKYLSLITPHLVGNSAVAEGQTHA